MSRKLLETEEKMSREEASKKLKDIAEKIAEGRMELKSAKDSLELTPGEQVEFEIDVEKEQDGDLSLEIEIEWSEDQSNGKLEIN